MKINWIGILFFFAVIAGYCVGRIHQTIQDQKVIKGLAAQSFALQLSVLECVKNDPVKADLLFQKYITYSVETLEKSHVKIK